MLYMANIEILFKSTLYYRVFFEMLFCEIWKYGKTE